MPQQTLWTMESVNLVVGDTGGNAQPGESTHLSIQELKLPALEEAFTDHVPGGAYHAIEINSHITRLESTFNLAGWQPNVFQYIRNEGQSDARYTAYGLVRDRRTGDPLNAVAKMWGRMGRVNPVAFSKGNLFHHEYSIRGITHYQLIMQLQPGVNTELYYWDFFENERRVMGVSVSSQINALLGIV